jgi:response regulator of citrate/malate metabolism
MTTARIFIIEDDLMVATLMKQALSKNEKYERIQISLQLITTFPEWMDWN